MPFIECNRGTHGMHMLLLWHFFTSIFDMDLRINSKARTKINAAHVPFSAETFPPWPGLFLIPARDSASRTPRACSAGRRTGLPEGSPSAAAAAAAAACAMRSAAVGVPDLPAGTLAPSAACTRTSCILNYSFKALAEQELALAGLATP